MVSQSSSMLRSLNLASISALAVIVQCQCVICLSYADGYISFFGWHNSSFYNEFRSTSIRKSLYFGVFPVFSTIESIE